MRIIIQNHRESSPQQHCISSLVLVVEVGPLSVKHLDHALALREAGGGSAVQWCVVRVRMLNVGEVR